MVLLALDWWTVKSFLMTHLSTGEAAAREMMADTAPRFSRKRILRAKRSVGSRWSRMCKNGTGNFILQSWMIFVVLVAGWSRTMGMLDIFIDLVESGVVLSSQGLSRGERG